MERNGVIWDIVFVDNVYDSGGVFISFYIFALDFQFQGILCESASFKFRI